MSIKASTYDLIEYSVDLHDEIADSMIALRDHIDNGTYSEIHRLIDRQIMLAEKAGLLTDTIISNIATGRGVEEQNEIDKLIKQIERALISTNDIVEYVAAEKSRVNTQLCTLQNGKRAVQSYARLSGR